MKLTTISVSGHAHAAVHFGQDGLLDLVQLRTIAPAALLIPKSAKGILQAGSAGLDLLRRVLDDAESGRFGSPTDLAERGIVLPRASTQLLPPVPDPSLVVSSGAAYRDHLHEMKVVLAADAVPRGFIKAASALTGSGSPIVLPPQAPTMVDWEGEFACVIGRPCYNVAVADALDYVAGYTLINDVSARDWVRGFLQAQGTPMEITAKGGLNVLGKQFPSFCPIGPCIVTKDEVPDPGRLQLRTRVNGELMQDANTCDQVYTLAQTIAHFSRWYQFLPGDVITTGTPSGVGFGRKPPLFLKPGDVVEVSVPEIGILRSPVVAG